MISTLEWACLSITVGVECFLIQLLDTGFFHADPHPGNLLVTRDGRLALIDFGKTRDMSGTIFISVVRTDG